MNILLLIIILALSTLSSAEEIYKSVDENGNVTYSDSPPSEGAAPADLPDIIIEPSLTPRVHLSPDKDQDTAAIRISISSPSNEDLIPGTVSSFPVSGKTNRPLAEGENALLLVNGQPYGSAGKSLQWNVGNLIRGEYSLQIKIVQNGKSIATSQAVKLFVQRNIAR